MSYVEIVDIPHHVITIHYILPFVQYVKMLPGRCIYAGRRAVSSIEVNWAYEAKVCAR